MCNCLQTFNNRRIFIQGVKRTVCAITFTIITHLISLYNDIITHRSYKFSETYFSSCRYCFLVVRRSLKIQCATLKLKDICLFMTWLTESYGNVLLSN